MNVYSNVAAILTLSFFCNGICSASYALNYTCSPPVAQGGNGYCGPSFCDISASSAKDCVFTSKNINYQASVSKLASKSCVQSTDPRCASAALAAVIVGGGVKAAYCNDAFLVIVSDGTPGFPTYLTSIKKSPWCCWLRRISLCNEDRKSFVSNIQDSSQPNITIHRRQSNK